MKKETQQWPRQSRRGPNASVLEKIRTEADYFERDAGRLRDPPFHKQHCFAGSGVIEAGCQTVIRSRVKPSGLFGSVRGAHSIIALRGCRLNGRLEDHWEGRRAAQLQLLCRAPIADLRGENRPYACRLGHPGQTPDIEQLRRHSRPGDRRGSSTERSAFVVSPAGGLPVRLPRLGVMRGRARKSGSPCLACGRSGPSRHHVDLQLRIRGRDIRFRQTQLAAHEIAALRDR